MEKMISKIAMAVLLGIMWGLIWFFDLLQYVPGFHCEGFGCIGLGLVYFIYMPILSFSIIGGLTFFFVKENKFKHIVISLGIMIVVLVVIFFAVSVFQNHKKQQSEDYCQIDSDCVVYFVAGKNCGECATPLTAINKKYAKEFKDGKMVDYHGLKCAENIKICPEFSDYKAKCRDNFCVADLQSLKKIKCEAFVPENCPDYCSVSCQGSCPTCDDCIPKCVTPKF